MSFLVRCLSCVVLLSCCAFGQSRHPVNLEDLESLKGAGSFELSPDGHRLAYTVSDVDGGQGTIWIVETGEGSTPVRVARGVRPAWSPDNKRLAYGSSESGSFQLWLYNIQNQKTEQITSLSNGIQPTARGWYDELFRWSPDGDQILFASNVDSPIGLTASTTNPASTSPDPDAPLVLTNDTPREWTLAGVFAYNFATVDLVNGLRATRNTSREVKATPVSQLFTLDLRTKRIDQVTHEEIGFYGSDWSPDGKTIVCLSAEGRSDNNTINTYPSLYLVDVATGRKHFLRGGPRDRMHPRWSPDGKWIAYLEGDWFTVHSVMIIPSEGGSPTTIAAAPDVFNFFWTSNTQITLEYAKELSHDLAQFDMRSQQLTPLMPEQRYVQWRELAASVSGSLAWRESTATAFSVIEYLPAHATASYTVTDLNPQIESWELGEADRYSWKTSTGETREGVLIKPFGYVPGHRYPLIVECYPNLGVGFYGDALGGNQSWASHGYVVFMPHHLAPHVWEMAASAKRQAAFKGPKGWDVTVDEIMSGVDQLIKDGIVDPNRMGLYGFSNGGGVAGYLVTRTQRFRCAVVIAAVFPDWVSPILLEGFEYVPGIAGGITPWSDPNGYVQLSAVFHLDKVSTPMLLANGDADPWGLLGMVEMYNGLRLLGKDVTLLRYPDQGHGFKGRAMRDFWNRENEFFAKNLLAGPSSNNAQLK